MEMTLLSLALQKTMWSIWPHCFLVTEESTFSRSPCMAFLPPSGGVLRLSLLGVIAVYPMQTVMRFSRCGAGFGNKKSPHNNLNLTIPSGMALVRVCYVAIRKLKTWSDSFGSRAGTLSKYVILNCWNRLPQKSSCVNKKIWKYATFGGLQEKAMKTLAKRERAGRYRPPCGS